MLVPRKTEVLVHIPLCTEYRDIYFTYRRRSRYTIPSLGIQDIHKGLCMEEPRDTIPFVRETELHNARCADDGDVQLTLLGRLTYTTPIECARPNSALVVGVCFCRRLSFCFSFANIDQNITLSGDLWVLVPSRSTSNRKLKP